MSAIRVNLDGLDSSAIQIRTVALTLGDLKSSMNRVFSSIDPKIKRRRNIGGSIADIQKEMEMLYTEMNELGSFISSSKSQYANTEARLFQMSSDYTNRFRAMLASANAEENWLERIGYAVIGNAEGLESFLKQAGDLIVNVGSKVISGVEGVAVSSVCNCVEGFANAGFGVAEFFHLVPDTSARYEFKHDLDAFQAAIADKYVLDKQWYYGGRAIGDIASSIVGTKIAVNGLIAVAAGLVGEGVGAGFTVTGAGAVAGVPAMVVSGAAAAVGALEVAAGLSVSAVSIKNFRDDFSKFQKEGEDKGETNSIDDILDGATPGRDTKGKTKQWEKSGGYEKALEDYNRLKPAGSRDIETGYGTGYTGTLPDGSKINARPGSSCGKPTLEIQKPNGTKIKIRYGE